MAVDFAQNGGSFDEQQKKSRIAVLRIGSFDSSAHSQSSILLGLTAKEDPFSRRSSTDLGMISPDRLWTDFLLVDEGVEAVVRFGNESVGVLSSVVGGAVDNVGVVMDDIVVVVVGDSPVEHCCRNAFADFLSGQRRHKSARYCASVVLHVRSCLVFALSSCAGAGTAGDFGQALLHLGSACGIQIVRGGEAWWRWLTGSTSEGFHL